MAPAMLWKKLLGVVPTSHGPRRAYRCREAVLTILAEKHPDLYNGTPHASLTSEELARLTELLAHNASSAHALRTRLNFLRAGLERGSRELDWQVSIPLPAKVVVRPRTRLNLSSFDLLSKIRHIEKQFMLNLEKDHDLSQHQLLGQLLLSAILFGGLLESKLIELWLKALSGGLHRIGTVTWLEIKQTVAMKHTPSASSWRHENWQINRRWCADPVTSILLMRYATRLAQPPDNAGPWQCIKSYLNRIGMFGSPASLSQLLQMSETRLRLQLPPFLVDYAAGSIKSVALPLSAWVRFLTDRAFRSGNIKKTESAVLHVQTLTTCSGIRIPEQVALLRSLKQAILPYPRTKDRTAGPSKKAIQTLLDQQGPEMSPVMQLLTHWSLHLLTHHKDNSEQHGESLRLKPSSARRYLQSFADKLLSEAGVQDITTLDSDELSEIYRTVLNLVPSSRERIFAARILGYFNSYLTRYWQASPVDIEEFAVSTGPRELGVDANLITPAAYDAVLESLRLSEPDHRLKTIRELVLILGFRCGLRRREALCLRLIDIHPSQHPELLIRRTVKTTDSMRRIPLYALLSDQEYSLLLSWYQQRIQEDGGNISKQALLFCTPHAPTALLHERQIFDPIESALRSVSGDRSLRFHHLRHSCATWTFIRLMAASDPPPTIPALSPERWPHTPEKLLKNLTGNDGSQRRCLYLVAQLCGHASPETTLLHYIHLCDWLLMDALSRPDSLPFLTEQTMMSLSGLKRAACYKTRRQNEVWQLSHFLPGIFKRNPAALVSPLAEQTFEPKPIQLALHDKDTTLLTNWRTIQQLLEAPRKNTLNLLTLEETYGFTFDQAISCLEERLNIAGMQTRNKSGQHCTSRLRFPIAPRQHNDIAIAERIFTRWDRLDCTARTVVLESVEYFINHYSINRSDIRCKDLKTVKKLIRTLQMLGVMPGEILIRLYPGIRECETPLQRTIKIAETLGIELQQILLKSEKGRQWRQNLHDAYGLQVTQIAGKDRKGRLQIKASYGFRYGMYLIAITKQLRP